MDYYPNHPNPIDSKALKTSKYRQRANIEQENPDHGLIDRFWKMFLSGSSSFRCRHADQLNAAKGKHHKGQHIKQAFKTMWEEAAMYP